MQYAIIVFDIVDLGSSMSPPEVVIEILMRIWSLLESFIDEEILPQLPEIITILDRVHISYEGISDSEIPEVDLIHFYDFISEISRESRDTMYDKCLFEKTYIPNHGFSIEIETIGEFMYRDLLPYLECEETQEFDELFWIPQSLE